jgi:hypothetical protein
MSEILPRLAHLHATEEARTLEEGQVPACGFRHLWEGRYVLSHELMGI